VETGELGSEGASKITVEVGHDLFVREKLHKIEDIMLPMVERSIEIVDLVGMPAILKKDPALVPAERRENGAKHRMEIAITPCRKGEFEGGDFDCKRWNMTVKEISQFRDPDLFLYRKNGVYVRGVRYPGNAQSAGLQRRDIIITVDGKPVRSLNDFKKIYAGILRDQKREKQVAIQVIRNGYPMLKILDYRRDYTEE